MTGALISLFVVACLLLFSGTGEKKKTKPLPEPTERDKVVEEMIFTQYGGAIASMTPAGRTHLAEEIRQISPKDKSIK